ncbi:MAG: methyltransferase domain-containing protein [Thermogemmatispora sp.]|uniref:class I SAM-dependent methyltransferase n=1 Tax=Thermogemmatispora sp. TaxID=1968838 RepID=UPI0019FA448A|nr:class I SAM-dependent methyltransferase [Thermogemmatispora sp.]MBE3564639.1 methyltransferase domain-containing protein [Thermogemmatispora sp.]
MDPTGKNNTREEDQNSYVIDSENAGELARLMHQDQMLTRGMGGLFPEFPEGAPLPAGGRVLDLACGPGGWALEVAFAYPNVEVIGVDISQAVIEYANAQAWSRGLENAHFRVMDVMQPLAFPDASFDLINGRLLLGFMLPEAWPKLLAECRRLLKPGGIIRLTESESGLTTSPAAERFNALLAEALKKAGQSFSADGRHIGITPVLPRLVRQAGFEEVKLRASAIECSMGTEGYYPMLKDWLMLQELIQPFLIKMGVATGEELGRLIQQATAEMQQEDFCGLYTLLTVWGRKPQ